MEHISNVDLFADGFLNELHEYVKFSQKYYQEELKKISSKLKFLLERNLGFQIFCSEGESLCIAFLNHINTKAQVKIGKNLTSLFCEDLFFNSLLNKTLLTEGANNQIKEYLKVSYRNSIFSLKENSKLTLSDVNLVGSCLPFDLDKTSESIIMNTYITIKPTSSFAISKTIPFLYIGNKAKFTREYGKSLFIEIVNLAKFMIETKSESKQSAEEKLNSLIRELENLLISQDTSEKDIEDFFTSHPYLLELALNIKNLIPQPKLPNIDLKPDLIAFDTLKDEWVIIDYKLSKYEKLTTSIEWKRLKLSEKVNSLKAQLHDYIDYFNDSKNREAFKNEYKIDVKEYPYAIGIIGLIKDKDEKERFNKARKREEKREIKIYTYDEILNSLKNTAKKFSKINVLIK